MKATGVFTRTGLMLGFVVIGFSMLPARAETVDIMVEGTIKNGKDKAGYFGKGKHIPEGTPFSLVFSFDDTKPDSKRFSANCFINGVVLSGQELNSPGTAILKINDRSFPFGTTFGFWSEMYFMEFSACTSSEILMAVGDRRDGKSFKNYVSVRVSAQEGKALPTDESGWQKALSLHDFEPHADNFFRFEAVNRRNVEAHLAVASITIRPRGSQGGKENNR